MDDGRVNVQARVRRASAARLDEIAAARPGWTRSDALRHLLGLGLAAYDGKPAPGSPARPPVEEARPARPQPKAAAGRRRDR